MFPFRTLILVLFLMLPIFGLGSDQNDALAPQSRSEDALTRQLHTATIATCDLNASLLFYRDAMGMRVRGPLALSEEVRAKQRLLWRIPPEIDWQLYLFDRPGAPTSIQIRLLVLGQNTPSIHRSWQALEAGPFSLGFPNQDQASLDKRVRQHGFGSLNPMSSYQVPRPDGSHYTIHETIFNGPDFVHGVGIQRDNGMAQLGPIDPATGLGGPAYSAQMVHDSESILNFYTGVLGLELRSDREWKSAGSKGALNVPDGTVFRFSIVYAKGATAGHLLFVHYRNREPISTGVPPVLPNRGLVMWSFPVKSLSDVQNRLKGAGHQLLAQTTSYKSPSLGSHTALTVAAPNGFTVELFEPTTAKTGE